MFKENRYGNGDTFYLELTILESSKSITFRKIALKLCLNETLVSSSVSSNFIPSYYPVGICLFKK